MRAPELLDPDPRDVAVMRGYPGRPWLVPMPIGRPSDGVRRFVCRLCVARGTAEMWPTAGEVVEHLRSFHHLEAL